MERSKHRFEFFSDGVMAIIITIMVLEIPLPDAMTFEAIFNFFYSIFIFFVSFFIVGYFWNKHHGIIDLVNKTSKRLIWKNMLFLFFIALLPIFTKWVLNNPNEIIPVYSYILLFIFINLSYFILFKEVHKEKLIKMKALKNHLLLKKIWRKIENHDDSSLKLHALLIAILMATIVISSIIFPQIAVVLFMGFPILYSVLNIFLGDRNSGKNYNE